MAVWQTTLQLSTRGLCDVIDISRQVQQAVVDSGIGTGIVNVSGLGSTVGITTIEFEPGAVQDLREAFDRIAPVHDAYAHNARWGDHNGFSHLRSALLGASRTFPVRNGRLHTGTWQQVVLCDFDDRPRQREVTVTVIGD